MTSDQPTKGINSVRSNITMLAKSIRIKAEQDRAIFAKDRANREAAKLLPKVARTKEDRDKARVLAAETIAQKPDCLNPRQELFCQMLVQGALHYQAAKESGYHGDDRTLSVTAARLLSLRKIKERVAELQMAMSMNAKLTRDGHMVALSELRDKARSSGQYGAAIRAEELRGKLSGLYDEDGPGEKIVGEEVAKLPVEEQLSLVRLALQRIQAMTGTHIEMTIDHKPTPPTLVPIAPIEPEPLPETKSHDFNGIDEESIGLEPRRTLEDD